MESPETFRIGELARRVGATPRAVRYYEELGLLPGRDRSGGAHRVYDERDEQRLRDLLRIRDLLGLTLIELREWMDAEDARARLRERWNEQPAPDEETRAEIIREALDHLDTQQHLVRSRLSALEQLEDELSAKRRRMRSMLVEIEGAPV
jgi:MerR family transcriptional regulator, repressor of the yfmOP operon